MATSPTPTPTPTNGVTITPDRFAHIIAAARARKEAAALLTQSNVPASVVSDVAESMSEDWDIVIFQA